MPTAAHAKKPKKSGRRTPTQARSQALAEAVLTAASQVLEERGYRAATTTLVAERAGVSIGSLYQYFPDKEALLVAVLGRELAGNAQHFQRLAKGDGEGGGGGLIGGMARRFLAKRKLFKILLIDAPASIRVAAMHRIRMGYVDQLELMLKGLPVGERLENPRIAAFVCLHAVVGILHGWLLAEPPPEGLTEAVLTVQLEAVVDGYFQRL